MGVFSRLSDIVNSNVTAMLDRAEDPEKMIRLIVFEMEDTLVEVRAAAAKTIAERKEVERTLARHRDAQEQWRRKAELALSKGREDLSRGALVEKARIAEAARDLEGEVARLDDALARSEEDIGRLEEKLKEARAKQRTLVARHETASNRLRVRKNLYDRRMEEAFTRFDQVEKRLDAVESEVEAYDLGRPRTLTDEIGDLEREAAIDRELADLKAGMPHPGDDR